MSIVERVAAINTNLDARTRSAEFVRAAQCLAAGGTWTRGADIAKAIGCTDRVVDVMTKSAVTPGVMSDALSTTGLVAAFVDSLRNFGAFDAILPSIVRVPMKTKIALTTVGATGFVIGEGQAKRLSSLSLTGSELDPSQVRRCHRPLGRACAVSVVVCHQPVRQRPAERRRCGDRHRVPEHHHERHQPCSSSGANASGARQDIRILLSAVSTGSARRSSSSRHLRLLRPSRLSRTTTGPPLPRCIVERRSD